MQISDHGSKALIENVSVYLRGRNIGMPEQSLHDPQIRSIMQKVAREGMPQHMRAQLFRSNARRRGKWLEFTGEVLTGQMTAAAE